MTNALSHPWAKALIPFARAFIRFAPPSSAKESLWQQVVEPYLAWRGHQFVASTVAGRISGNTNDIIQQYLYYFGTWEPQVTAFVLRRLQPGDGFVDVGANIGFFSLLASRKVGPRGSVVSIEASPEIYALLQTNISRNRARVRALNFAASDSRGQLELYAGDECNCGTTTIAAAPGTIAKAVVQAAPLDELLTPEEAAQARLVKIDVEGAEAAVIAGAELLLQRQDCEFLVELHPEMLARLDRCVEDVLQPFRAAGYHAYVLENDYEATAYLQPSPPRRLQKLRTPIEEDTNIVFSRTDAEEL